MGLKMKLKFKKLLGGTFNMEGGVGISRKRAIQRKVFSWLLVFVLVLAPGMAQPAEATEPQVVSVAGGGNHSLALKDDGTVFAWGYNEYGQLGDGTAVGKDTPVQVRNAAGTGYLSDITAIASGTGHCLALKDDGTVWAWGRNDFGQLGDGTVTERHTPVQVTGLSGITAITAGYYHCLALKNDGTVWAWGLNANGQLGDGTYGVGSDKTAPVQVTGLSGITAITAGSQHSLALKNDGTAWAWGYNSYGQLGNGTSVDANPFPAQVAQTTGLSGITALAAGTAHSLALKNDDTWAWGGNYLGQLGDGRAPTGSHVPVRVLDAAGTGYLSDITALAAGWQHSLALKNDGTVWAWGDNYNGQLGDGQASTVSHVPVQVRDAAEAGYLSDITAITAGYYHCLALKDDGTVWAWGLNDNGQLGNGTVTSSHIPVQVAFPAGNVCEIVGGEEYPFLDDALDAALDGPTDGHTIRLLEDINFQGGILVNGKTITFDVNGFDLNVVNAAGYGLRVEDGAVNLTGSGEFNVTGTTYGLTIWNGTATVTNATATGASGIGAYAGSGGSVHIENNAEGILYGVTAQGADSSVSVTGDAEATGAGSYGAYAGGGDIEIFGDVQGGKYGVSADSSESSVFVGGNALATESDEPSAGVHAQDGGTVEITGNVQGGKYGALAASGGRITIDGAILMDGEYPPTYYIRLGGDIVQFHGLDAVSTLEGYRTYSRTISDVTSTVWIRDVSSDDTPPVWTSGYPRTFNVQDEDLILVISADENCTAYYVVLADGTAGPGAGQVRDCQDAEGDTAPGGSFSYTTPPNERNHAVLGLTPATAYDIYVVLEDTEGNLQVEPASIDVTTLPDIDTVPYDANSGITNQVQGANGSKQVALTITVQNEAGDPLTGIGPGYFEVSVNGATPERFDLSSSFSGFTDIGGGVYTVIFTGSSDSEIYSFTNLKVNNVPIEAGPTTVTTPQPDNSDNRRGGGSSSPSAPKYNAVLEGTDASDMTLPVNVDAARGSVSVELEGLAEEPLTVTMPLISGVNAYALGIPAASLSGAGTGDALTFATGIGSLTIPGNMLSGTGLTGDAEITIGRGDTSGLPDDVKTAIGDRPVIQLTLSINGRQIDWNNPDAPVTVSVPYAPTAAELADPEHIVVWYIDGSGNTVSVPNGRYDPVTGTVSFTTTHFSQYAVTYVHKTFGDLTSSEWARKSIEVLASKGIVSGAGANTFSPAADITRADYLILLIKTLNLTAVFENNFDDVSPDAYYYEAAGIAKKLGIAAGRGNNLFNPRENITRQDMMMMTAKALESYKGLKAAGDPAVLDRFNDKGDIAAYAAGSMAALVKEGLTTGSGDRLNPRAPATRAEAAAFLYRIYDKYSGNWERDDIL